jgi:serine dehydrogenase proteinase
VFSRQGLAQEIVAAGSPFDVVRRRCLRQLNEYTKRNTILYAMRPQHASIVTDDIQGFMAAIHDLKGDDLDLILHSPGGSSEAAEQIVNYLREKFKNIRVIVPLYAMSAATMIACSADEIIMGRQSAIGPVDPQFVTQNGLMPAHAIIDEFDTALAQIKEDPKAAVFWVPKLSTLQHGYYSQAKTVLERAETLCRDWLKRFMKLDEPKADQIAKWLASSKHGSHGKPISAVDADSEGLNVTLLENDQDLQDLVLAVFHCTMLTLEGTACFKFIENHLGKGYFQIMQQGPQLIQIPQAPPIQPIPNPNP